MLLRATLVILLAMLSGTPVRAQSDTVLLKRAAELRQAPGDTSTSVATLPVQTPLTRLALRQGPWIQVRTASGQTGWVHMFDLGSGSAPSAAGSGAAGALRGLTNFFSGGSAQSRNTTTATSTVGIRGMRAEDIANAHPDVAALAKMDAQRVDAAQARRFAADAALTARVVEPLPVPPPPPPASAPGRVQEFKP